MNSRWDRVTALFDAARALDPAARSAFLEIACAGDTDQRAEVEALLASEAAAAATFLVEPFAPELESLLRQSRALRSGQILKNRYRVDELFSVGGHALVYKAMDELLGRPVVVKVLRAEGRCNDMMRTRLHDEMQALARIDHPGVVGILDTVNWRTAVRFWSFNTSTG